MSRVPSRGVRTRTPRDLAEGRGASHLSPLSDGPRSAAWARLTREIEQCRACPLHAHRTHVVVYRGGPHPKVVFIGEAPGAEEDRVGRPFVGRAGRRLDAAIARLGLAAEDVGILNLLKCRPPDNRFDRRAQATCRPFLDRQLDLLAPRVLVPMGAHALRALRPDAPPVTEVAGHLVRTEGAPLFPLLHPAAAMHAPRYRERWERDVSTLARELPRLLGESL